MYVYIYIYTHFQKRFHPEIYMYIDAYFCLAERAQACMTNHLSENLRLTKDLLPKFQLLVYEREKSRLPRFLFALHIYLGDGSMRVQVTVFSRSREKAPKRWPGI